MTFAATPRPVTPQDLEAVRAVLPEADGWRTTLEADPDCDAPWIAAIAPSGVGWTIGRQGAAFFAVSAWGLGRGWDGLASAWDAACFIAEA